MKKFTDREIENEIRRIWEEEGRVNAHQVSKRLSASKDRIKRFVDRFTSQNTNVSTELPIAEEIPVNASLVAAGKGHVTSNAVKVAPPNPVTQQRVPVPAGTHSHAPEQTADPLVIARRLSAIEARLDLLALENRSLQEEIARERMLRQQTVDRLILLVNEFAKNIHRN